MADEILRSAKVSLPFLRCQTQFRKADGVKAALRRCGEHADERERFQWQMQARLKRKNGTVRETATGTAGNMQQVHQGCCGDESSPCKVSGSERKSDDAFNVRAWETLNGTFRILCFTVVCCYRGSNAQRSLFFLTGRRD